MRAGTSALLWAAAAAWASGCYKLDPFLYTPQRVDRYVWVAEGPDAESTVSPDRILEPEPLVTPTGIHLGAVYVSGNVQPPLGYALFLHGKGSCLSGDQFERIKRLANLGYDVFAIDYRGFGISTNVAPTEAGIEEDTRTALGWLTARLGGASRVFFYGHSLGSAAAVQRAELDPPNALVLESAFASIEELKTDSTLMDFPWQYVAEDGWPTSTRIRDVHVPVLILHGLDDDFVRPEFSQRLYDVANEPKQLELVPGAGHGDIPKTLGPAYKALVNGFVGQYVSPP